MATYSELYSLRHNASLRQKVIVAIAIAADTIRSEDPGVTNHANRLTWAATAFSNPIGKVDQVWWAVLAANKAATVAAITGATDAAFQTNVDAVVDVLAGA